MEERIALTTGKKSNKQLAEWFGVRPQSFSNKKESYIERLKEYAEFEVLSTGKINIITVLKPYYCADKAKDIIEQYLPICWNKNGYDKTKYVEQKIREKTDKENPNGPISRIKQSTSLTYLRETCADLYGHIRRKEGDFGGGRIGYREMAWCKEELDENNHYLYTPLTKEELEVVQRIWSKCFGTEKERSARFDHMVMRYAEGTYEEGQFDDVFLETTGFDTKDSFQNTYYFCLDQIREELGFDVQQCIHHVNYADRPQIKAIGY